MASGTTRRTASNTIAGKALLWPKTTDPDTLSADLHAIAEALENDAETGEGKLSERPAAKLRGRLFYVNEGPEEGLWWDTGSVWVLISDKPLNMIESAISVTADNGERVKATAAITVTSPTTALDAYFGAVANGNEVTIELATGEVYIYGEKTKKVIIFGQQTLTLQSDGTNWFAVAENLIPELVQHSSSFTFKPGEVAESTGVVTGKLPAASGRKGQRLSAWGGATTTIKCENSESIYGDFINNVSSITLLYGQHVELVSDGANWIIVAGEPKREQTYSALTGRTQAECEAGLEPSATRPALVTMFFEQGGAGTPSKLAVGGVEMGNLYQGTAGTEIVTFIVPPAQKWKLTWGSGIGQIKSSYLLL